MSAAVNNSMTLAGSGTPTIWIALMGARKPFGVVSVVSLTSVNDGAVNCLNMR
jgi:hypothetical protein